MNEMTESAIITQAKHKIENYEKGLNLIKEIIVDFLKQDSLGSKFAKMQDALEDIKIAAESMANIRQEDAYLTEYFDNKFSSLKNEALTLLSTLSKEEFRLGGQKAQEFFNENTEWLKNSIKENPLVAATIAFSIGLLVSGMLRSNKC
jgi:hypothetical protein